MRGIAKTFWSSLVAGLLLVASSAAQSPALKSARPASDDSIQSQIQEPQGTLLYFPDYVDGGGWSVQLVLSNIDADTATEVRVAAYDQDGGPILDLFDSELTVEIPSLGSRVLRSAGAEAIRRGWIEVQADSATVSGLLTYRHAQTGIEVSVEPSSWGMNSLCSSRNRGRSGRAWPSSSRTRRPGSS